MNTYDKSNIMNLVKEEREGREERCWYRPIVWIVLTLIMMATAAGICWVLCRVWEFVATVMGWS
jgi:hypothetical protein